MIETISRECGNIDVKRSKSSTHLTDSRDILYLLRQQRNTVYPNNAVVKRGTP